MSHKGIISIHPNTIRRFDFLKKYYLFFDSVAVTGAGVPNEDIAEAYDEIFEKEYRDLLEKQVIVNIEKEVPSKKQFATLAENDPKFARTLSEFFAAEQKIGAKEKEIDKLQQWVSDNVDGQVIYSIEDVIKHFSTLPEIVEMEHIRERIVSEYLTITSKGDSYTPVLYQECNTGCISSTDVVSLVISNFPLVRNDVSWERICDFKSDEGSRIKLLRFRQFSKKLANQRMSAKEIQEEIEWMLEEYKQHLKLANMKYEIGRLEGIYLSSLKFVENLLSLKPSEAFGSLYSAKKNRIELLQAELNSPGKEVALLALPITHK